MALNNEEIGQRIRNIRKLSNMTQVKFSEKMHMTQQTLSRYESGKTSIPNDIIENIAQEFSVPLSYVFGISTDDITEDEWLLIEYYRKVDGRLKKRVFALVQAIADDFSEAD
ncbi:MAG: helix-turn-helix transcriptional regulator [Lachnospiraceae bacterium]|nr:helix-turn-helix transcriptional regulator [Lachnospiraceae bacterium]